MAAHPPQCLVPQIWKLKRQGTIKPHQDHVRDGERKLGSTDAFSQPVSIQLNSHCIWAHLTKSPTGWHNVHFNLKVFFSTVLPNMFVERIITQIFFE
jgi:hypothetical protein